MRYHKSYSVQYNKTGMRIIAFVFMLIGVVFLAVGIGFVIYANNMKNKCTLEVTAVVSDILSKEERHENDDGYTTYTTVYTPVYTYYANGQMYTSHSNTYSSNSSYRRGQTVQLFCDPDDPITFYSPKDTTSTILTVVFCGIGGLFIVIATVFIILLVRFKNKPHSGHKFVSNEIYEENNYPYNE